MPDKDQAARSLAAAHYETEPGITRIFRLHAGGQAELQAGEPIKLLEINENTIAAGIMPLGFAPAPEFGVHFPSIIVEVTPAEFEQIQAQALSLPAGWNIGDLLPRPSAGAVA